MKNRILSIACILSLIISMLSYVGAAASEEVVVLSLDSMMQKGKEIAFEIEIDNSDISYDESRLAVSVYDADGDLLEMQSELIGYDDTSVNVSLLAHSDMASCKVMLLEGKSGIKPLCPSLDKAVILNDIPTSDEVYIQNVGFLSSVGVYNIPQLNTLNPRHEVTRAEFTAALMRSIGAGKTAKIYSAEDIFEDVPSDFWAAGYINLAAESGIANGKSEKVFNPYGTLTYDEAVIAVLKSLGYGLLIEKEGGYPYGYIKVAKQTGITDGLEAQNVLTADNMATLIINAVEACHMAPVSVGNEPEWAILDGKNGNDYRTSLTEMNIYKATGIVGEITEDKIDFLITENSEDGMFILYNYPLNMNFLIGNSNIADYKNQLVEAYVHEYDRGKYEVISVSPSVKMQTITILSQDIIYYDDYCTEIEYYIDGTDKRGSINVVQNIEAVLNNGHMGRLSDLLGEEDIELKFIDNTGDNVYDVVVATQYVYDRITSAIPEAWEMKLMYNGEVFFDFGDDSCEYQFTDIYGTKLSLDSFGEGDIVAISADPNIRYYIKMIKINDSFVTGTVEEITYDYVTVDGKKYLNDLYEEISVGDTGTFYLNSNGGIVMADIGMFRSIEGPGEEAEQEPEAEETMTEQQYLSNVSLLSQLGIIEESNHTEPARKISRAEFAVSLCTAMNVMDMTSFFADMEKFDDVPSDYYAAGCINYLAHEGIMSASEENKFAPEDIITYKDAMDTSVLALGFGPIVEAEGYPMGSLRTANSYGINDNIVIEAYVTSEIFVQLLNNIMTIPVMKLVAVGNNDAQYAVMNGKGGYDYITLLTENDISIATGIPGVIEGNTIEFDSVENSDDGEFNYSYRYIFNMGDTDIASYKYQCVDAYVRKSSGTYTVIAIVKSPYGSTVEINSDDIINYDGYEIMYYVDGTNNVERIKVNYDGIYVELNNSDYMTSLDEVLTQGDVALKFIENNGDNCYDVAIGTKYSYGIVESVETTDYGILIILENGKEMLIEDDNTVNIVEDYKGYKISAHELSKGALIAYIAFKDKYSIVDMSEKPPVTGVATSVRSGGGVQFVEIDGNEYFDSIGYEFEVGNKYNIYLGITGKIIHAEDITAPSGGGATLPDFDIENEL